MANRLQWKWIGVGFLLSVALLSVLILIDGSLESLGVPGVSALQQARGNASFQAVIQSWHKAGAPALVRAGFSLGWDYLFLLSYGAVFVLGGLKTRDDLFPTPGIIRSLAVVIIVMMLAGTGIDALENVLQFRMITLGVNDSLAFWLSGMTLTKWLLVAPCIALTAAGATMAPKRWRPGN